MNTDLPKNSVNRQGGRYRYEGSEPCKTRYRLELDAGVVDGVAKEAGVYHYAIYWRDVIDANFDPGPPDYITLKRRDGTINSIKVPLAQRDVAMGLARELIAGCSTPPAAAPAPTPKPTPKPSPTPSPSASAPATSTTQAQPRLDPRWRFARRDASGIASCYYDMDPVSILVTEGLGFKLRVEGGGLSRQGEPQHRFSIDFMAGQDRIVSYQSVFSVTLPGKGDRNIVDMRVLLDGKRFDAPMFTRHYVSGDSHVFMGSFTETDAARFGDQFQGAKLMQWQLLDKSGGAVYEKVINLYWLPRAGEVLTASQWRCPAS